MQEIITRKESLSKGRARYFTGKPCKRNHISERWSSSAKCVACHYEEKPLQNIPRVSAEEKKLSAAIRAKRWYKKNRQKTIDRSKVWKKENREAVRKSESKWRSKKTSKAIRFMRDSLRRILKTEKNGRTEKILGYTRQELISHIESQFEKGMRWDNHGDWHIDHITPVSVLLSEGVCCPKKINCLSNLMPVWAEQNLKNNSKRKFLI